MKATKEKQNQILKTTNEEEQVTEREEGGAETKEKLIPGNEGGAEIGDETEAYDKEGEMGRPVDKRRSSPKTRNRSGRKASSRAYQTEIIPGKPGNPITPEILRRIESLAKWISEEIQKKK